MLRGLPLMTVCVRTGSCPGRPIATMSLGVRPAWSDPGEGGSDKVIAQRTAQRFNEGYKAAYPGSAAAG